MTIALADKQHALLKAMAKTRRMPMAEMVRKLVVEAGSKPPDQWPSRYRPRVKRATQ